MSWFILHQVLIPSKKIAPILITTPVIGFSPIFIMTFLDPQKHIPIPPHLVSVDEPPRLLAKTASPVTFFPWMAELWYKKCGPKIRNPPLLYPMLFLSKNVGASILCQLFWPNNSFVQVKNNQLFKDHSACIESWEYHRKWGVDSKWMVAGVHQDSWFKSSSPKWSPLQLNRDFVRKECQNIIAQHWGCGLVGFWFCWCYETCYTPKD